MNKVLITVIAIMGCCQLAYAQLPEYEVYAIKYAMLDKVTPISNWADKGPEKDSLDIAFMFWLIKNKTGKNILVDAGCSIDLQAAIDFGLTKFTRPDSMLLKLGIKAGDISDIIISHPHWDHIDGVSLFPDARVWIQKEDYDYYAGQAWQEGANHGGFAKRDILSLVERNISGRVTLVNGDNQEIIPGIKVYTGSRHTFNSQYAVVHSGNERIVIASDNVWIYYNLEKMLPPPSYGTFDAKGYTDAMRRMKKLASKAMYILPGHDDQLFRKFPIVADGIARIK
ncbi:MAG: N-acyl homoserine lactonase family protein [Chitinophagaceae bacterium]|nr:N-acyl homoserine lactonase family protein [Chitinophagaceae bacterium]